MANIKPSEILPVVDLTDGKELVVNRIIGGSFYGSLHVITLGGHRAGVDRDGLLRDEIAMIARLRFDNEMAKSLRDALDAAIKALAVPSDVKAN